MCVPYLFPCSHIALCEKEVPFSFLSVLFFFLSLPFHSSTLLFSPHPYLTLPPPSFFLLDIIAPDPPPYPYPISTSLFVLSLLVLLFISSCPQTIPRTRSDRPPSLILLVLLFWLVTATANTNLLCAHTHTRFYSFFFSFAVLLISLIVSRVLSTHILRVSFLPELPSLSLSRAITHLSHLSLPLSFFSPSF